MRRLGTILVAAGCLVALAAIYGNGQSSCTPVPVEPVPVGCQSDDDCAAGESCTADGECVSFTACESNDQCIEVPMGCCSCANGGQSTSINRAYAQEWEDSLDCPDDIACLTVYLCLDQFPACVEGQCQLVTELPEPGCVADADCAAGQICQDGECVNDGVCAADADCGADELCHGGECVNVRACTADSECVEVAEGCCPCSMGGTSTAINGEWAGVWQDHVGCPPDMGCLAVYLCTGEYPTCLDGRCTMHGGF